VGKVRPCVRVVDDDVAVLQSIDRLLRSAGFAVRTFSSSQDFLHRHDRDAPGCAVIDMSMPGLDGVALLETLARAGERCPVIFISGHDDEARRAAARLAGAAAFLAKPFDGAQLIAAVQAAVDKS
jgi:FixJ family two-component response regulator